MLRQARKTDGAAVFELLWATKDEIPLRPEFYDDDRKEWISKECSKGHVWVIEESGAIIGAILLQGAQIFYLVVSADHRYRGLARMLLRKVKRKGQWAQAQPANAAAIGLLESEGFEYDPNWLAGSGWHAYRLQ